MDKEGSAGFRKTDISAFSDCLDRELPQMDTDYWVELKQREKKTENLSVLI